MFGQGSNNVFVVGLLLALLWLIWRISQKLYLVSLYYLIIERYVQLKLIIGEHFYPIKQIGIHFYYLEQHAWVDCNAQEFVNKFWYVTNHGARIYQLKQFLLHTAWLEGLIVFSLGTIAAIIFCYCQGRNSVAASKIRGMDFVESKVLEKMLQKAKKASNIKFAGLPLVKSSERQHLLLTGTTGTGKTNTLNELLPQIRAQKERAIIVDLTGTFVERFFNPKIDKLLNPFEKNSQHWLPWNDCQAISDFDDVASSFSSYNPRADDFFAKNAELVLSEGLQLYKDSKDIKKLVNTIIYSDNKAFARIFKNTAVAGIISNSAPETSAGIQATVSKNIAALKHLQLGGNFSIRKWFTNPLETGWLFITASPNQRSTLCPLISAWISIAIKALMDRPTNTNNNNMWFVLDELPALQKIPSLPTALAESRKYGGCFVAGLQNIYQLEEIYGPAGSASMLDLFNSKFIFRVSDQQTAHRSALMLGEQETLETQESLSYGSNTMRDGVNINNIERKRLLVMPSEIMTYYMQQTLTLNP
ncbi:type IV secretion system DNA-binding domain-containing protein [Candidatus Tisiphia endosymbiont of Nemotelus uliginosus]|uniref:type IV secretion system DNA-binding domain-containing protein n=1 Tax=Candidatus Tisiphia endosymbiont of Nemotelus uliginosus TaxID=3077926 RepID=UPI0035C8FA22